MLAIKAGILVTIMLMKNLHYCSYHDFIKSLGSHYSQICSFIEVKIRWAWLQSQKVIKFEAAQVAGEIVGLLGTNRTLLDLQIVSNLSFYNKSFRFR